LVSGQHWPQFSLRTCPGHRGVRGFSLRNEVTGCELVTRTVPEAPSPLPLFRLRLSPRSRGLLFWLLAPFHLPWPLLNFGVVLFNRQHTPRTISPRAITHSC